MWYERVMDPHEAARFTQEFAEALNRRDRDAWVAAFHPDFEGYSGLAEAEGGEAYRGAEGAALWFDNLVETYESVRARLDQTIVVGNHALHLVRVEYVGKGSGVTLDALLGWVTEMKDGRYVYVRSHFGLADAFREMADRIR